MSYEKSEGTRQSTYHTTHHIKIGTVSLRANSRCVHVSEVDPNTNPKLTPTDKFKNLVSSSLVLNLPILQISTKIRP